MQKVIKHLPLSDEASGIRNADLAAERRLRMDKMDRDLNINFFLWGFLAGALVVTAMALYLHKP